jgi:hypothetical protein
MVKCVVIKITEASSLELREYLIKHMLASMHTYISHLLITKLTSTITFA